MQSHDAGGSRSEEPVVAQYLQQLGKRLFQPMKEFQEVRLTQSVGI